MTPEFNINQVQDIQINRFMQTRNINQFPQKALVRDGLILKFLNVIELYDKMPNQVAFWN